MTITQWLSIETPDVPITGPFECSACLASYDTVYAALNCDCEA